MAERTQDVNLRLQIGNVPENQREPPVGGGWRRIQSPGLRLGYLLAGLFGLVFPTVLCVWFVMMSMLAEGSKRGEPAADISTPWGAVAAALLLFIPVHEVLHAIWHPRQGMPAETVMVIWPAKLRFGVYYEGCMTRRRWLVMRLAPLVFLSVMPAGLLTLFHYVPVAYELVMFLQVMMLVNGIGSGGDVVAVIWVLFQVPAKAQIGFYGGKAYWRPGSAEDGMKGAGGD